MSDAELAAIAGCQHGLITPSQAKSCLSACQLRRHLATGVLVRLHGVLRHVACPVTWKTKLLAAVWSAGEGAVASHRSALALCGLRDRIDVTEITVPWQGWPRLRGVRVHNTNCLPPDQVTTIDGIPVTALGRTLLDASAVLHPEAYQRVIDHARRRHPGAMQSLDACVAAVSARGRRRTTVAREVIAACEGEHPGGSNQELRVARVLRRARLGRLVQQYKVVINGQTYYFDFAYPDDVVSVEHQGPHHADLAQMRYDTRRRNAIAAAGWHVVETTDDFADNEIVAAVRSALERSRKARESA